MEYHVCAGFLKILNTIIAMKKKEVNATTTSKAIVALPSIVVEKKVKLKSRKALYEESLLTDAEFSKFLLKVKNGNFTQRFPTLQGEFLRIAKEVNGMVKQLNLFSMEVTRVAREVVTDGKLGGASDYITKPVIVDQLSNLMRVWLK